MSIFVLIGVPGSGKGSVSNLLVKKNNFLHLSTGKIFRTITKQEINQISKKLNQSNNTEQVLNSGGFMSDDLTNLIMKQNLDNILSKNSDQLIILDGYPRTINQAQFLQNNFALKKVIFLTGISDEQIIKRLTNRYICKANEHTFNISSPLNETNKLCPEDGSPLYQRTDDKENIVIKRIMKYKELTFPIIEHYKKQGLVVEIDASGKLEDCYLKIINNVIND